MIYLEIKVVVAELDSVIIVIGKLLSVKLLAVLVVVFSGNSNQSKSLSAANELVATGALSSPTSSSTTPSSETSLPTAASLTETCFSSS